MRHIFPCHDQCERLDVCTCNCHITLRTIPRSQKAKGIVELSRFYPGYLPAFEVITTDAQLPLVQEARPENIWAPKPKERIQWPRFARPCPIRPRHGFVDSRVVNDAAEARRVWAEARAADPEAEMILMPPINAVCSAVATPASVCIGPRHDGATSGHGAIKIPLQSLFLPDELKEAAGITDTPYAEFVFGSVTGYGGNRLWITQLRNGPDPRKTIEVTATNIMALDPDPAKRPDTLKWEAIMRDAPYGTVVYHPGGTDTSHYAAHAILNGHPVVFDRLPRVGETVRMAPVEGFDKDGFREGIKAGWQDVIPYDYASARVNLGLLATHHGLRMATREGGWTLGYGLVMLIRLGMAATIGEARHARRRAPTRDKIYRVSLGKPLESLAKAARVYKLFVEHHWRSGFGGEAWANCLKRVMELDGALRRAYKRGDDAAIKDAIGAAHNLVNEMHNGGRLLNKFGADFDGHAVGEMYPVVKAAITAYQIYSSPRDADMAILQEWLKKRRPRLKAKAKAAAGPKVATKTKAPFVPLAVPTVQMEVGKVVMQPPPYGAPEMEMTPAVGVHVQVGSSLAYTSQSVALKGKDVEAIQTLAKTLPLQPSLSGATTQYHGLNGHVYSGAMATQVCCLPEALKAHIVSLVTAYKAGVGLKGTDVIPESEDDVTPDCACSDCVEPDDQEAEGEGGESA